MEKINSVVVLLNNIQEGLKLIVDARTPDSLEDRGEEALHHNEGRFQLREGCFYDYELSDPAFVLGDVGENIIIPHKRNNHLGTLAPNIFVGTLSIPVIEKDSGRECNKVHLEVQSAKSDYRSDYRDMLEFITERCTDLLLRADSPVSQHFDINYTRDSQTLYQKFSFIRSIIGTQEFADAVHKIIISPVTKWAETVESKDIRNVRRFSNANVKEIIRAGIRTKLPESHYLRSCGLETAPKKILSIRKTDSVDTPENRFVKDALQVFLKFCTDINSKAREFKHKKTHVESEIMIRELENQLHHSIFNEISRPNTLKINSPVLQRKEGYREVLRVWLMFDLAAKLIWRGGDDVYSSGKKDIATLYEYWLFFKLLELFQSIFQIEQKDISELIKETPDGLNLQLKQGKFTALQGIYNSDSRKLNIRFNYNRSFSGKKTYPDSGSWTTTLRPDYTLSIWPFGISEEEAEHQELTVHVHFDAKYKIASITDFIHQHSTSELDDEKLNNRKGIYKNADLLKMHSYKDAIRRTSGAYVLYPGTESMRQKGFHEIIPGLGAFPVRPSKTDSGIGELKAFILEVVEHFLNRTSQREKLAYRLYDIHKDAPKSSNELREKIPEAYGVNRALLPDETFVLVGYATSKERFQWYDQNKKYVFRMNDSKGSIELNNEVVNSKYLLIRKSGEIMASELFTIKSNGPKVFSSSKLAEINYPLSKNPKEYYLVIEIEKVTDSEFKNIKWEFKKLEKYKSIIESEPNKYSQVGLPFTVSLTELMNVVYKNDA